jgi:hypothetical protein
MSIRKQYNSLKLKYENLLTYETKLNILNTKFTWFWKEQYQESLFQKRLFVQAQKIIIKKMLDNFMKALKLKIKYLNLKKIKK